MERGGGQKNVLSRAMNKQGRYRKTISSSSPVTDMFRQLSQGVGAEVKAAQLSKSERSKLINADRARPDVQPPQWFPLMEDELYGEGAELPNHILLLKHLREEGRLDINCAIKLLGQAADVCREEPNLLCLTDKLPLNICGDIHGQFYDLINLLDVAGHPADQNFLFLGDYVDRGMFSTEVVLYMASLKVCYPETFFMLRGNHECRLLTSHFNFMDECLAKYDAEVYYMFMEFFDVLPIAAYVDNDQGRFLFVHGGISPELSQIEEINEVDRFVEPPGEGLLCDLLWADPIDESTGDGLTPDELLEWDAVDYVPNPDRGCSWIFGYSAIADFLDRLGLVTVVRAHEVQRAGFREHRFLKDREHPYLITVFSAPNYCDMYNNKAAFMRLEETQYQYQQTTCVDHPYYLPNFMDGLTYSLPFVMENLSRLAEDIMNICLPQAGEVVQPSEEEEVERLRQKILAVARMRHVMNGMTTQRRRTLTASMVPKMQAPADAAGMKKFEAAMQMDFMKEYLKPGATAQAAQTNAPIYRGRSRSLNFLDFAKHPPTLDASLKFSKNKQAVAAQAQQEQGPPLPSFHPAAKAAARTAAKKKEGSKGRRRKAQAMKFEAPPDLSKVEEEMSKQETEMSKKEKRRSRDDWEVKL